MALLAENLENAPDGERVIREMTGHSDAAVALIGRMQQALSAPYPFVHGEGEITLATHIVGQQIAMASELNDVFGQCQRVFDRYPDTYIRVLGSLARIALRVEARLGIEPLSLPEEE